RHADNGLDGQAAAVNTDGHGVPPGGAASSWQTAEKMPHGSSPWELQDGAGVGVRSPRRWMGELTRHLRCELRPATIINDSARAGVTLSRPKHPQDSIRL